MPAVEHRIAQGMKAFWADPWMRSRDASLPERLQRYSEGVPAIFLYGAEGWTANRCVLKRLRQLEGGLLRHVS
eukprot:4866336-Alexandrium_andersonii.AAC.1